MPGSARADTFAVLARSSTALLATFRSDGGAVTTPVSVTLRAGRAYFATATRSGKAARLRRCDRVELTACSVTGTPSGPTVAGRARHLGRGDARGLRLLRPTEALFWSWLAYRLRGHRMMFVEVTPPAPAGQT